VTNTTLVVLTTHFGTDFSGGSTATCEIFKRLQHRFSRVVVVGTQIGTHEFRDLEFRQYYYHREAKRLLSSLASQSNTLFYGDFYNAVILAKQKIPFYFTYHDNWPELGDLSVSLRIKRLYYWPAYKKIFKSAKHVFAVSHLKQVQIKNYTRNVSLVHNGVAQLPLHGTLRSCVRENVLMVGNIDARKYSKALALFNELPGSPNFHIDIYGHLNDTKIATLKGHVDSVPYHRYRLLLHTSLMENLSIVWCEAIMHGTTILSFDVGAAREVITPERGILVTDYNLKLMSDYLQIQLGKVNDSATASDPAQDCSTFLDEFNWERAAGEYERQLFTT